MEHPPIFLFLGDPLSKSKIKSGWWFQHFLFFHMLGIIIPTDDLIFFRGVGMPPTRNHIVRKFHTLPGLLEASHRGPREAAAREVYLQVDEFVRVGCSARGLQASAGCAPEDPSYHRPSKQGFTK